MYVIIPTPSIRRHYRIHQSFANLGELYRFHLEIIDLGAGPVIPQHLWEPRSEEKSFDFLLEDDVPRSESDWVEKFLSFGATVAPVEL